MKAGVIFAGAGFILLVATGITLWFALRPLNWPSAPATVTSSRVLGDQGGMYRAERGFWYSVNGRDYHVVDSSSWSSSSYAMIEREVARFPQGSRREIRVNPTDPQHISTTTSLTFGALLAPIILSVLTIVFGGIGVWALRPSFAPDRKVVFARKPSADELFAAARNQPAFPAHIFGWVFVPVGIIFLAIAGYSAKGQIDEARWPTVTAEVTRSDIRTGGRRGARYAPWIEFRYAVDGREHVTPTLGGVWTSSRGSVEATVADYAPGTSHEIRHDPAHPEIIRYGRPLSLMSLFLPIGMLVGGLVFLGFGIALPKVFRSSH